MESDRQRVSLFSKRRIIRAARSIERTVSSIHAKTVRNGRNKSTFEAYARALNDVERRYPAERYVLVDDKLRILTAVKQFWGERVTTIFVRQGSYAHDPKVINAFLTADITIEHIADLLDWDPLGPGLISPVRASSLESMR